MRKYLAVLSSGKTPLVVAPWPGIAAAVPYTCSGANTRKPVVPCSAGRITRENSNGTGIPVRSGATLTNSPPPSGFSTT
ncbi:hypothetical protein [Nonomuraea sp. NPDC049158]|uniref:hypothetical protein n=1 Tax=Nonomuraea sp. NPDC049158 TaxID=3155649 RepID=UPI0034090C07